MRATGRLGRSERRGGAPDSARQHTPRKALRDGHPAGPDHLHRCFSRCEEADYRQELRVLQSALANVEHVPNERKVQEVIRIAQDFAALWDGASHARRKQVVEALFETVTVLGGMVVAVRPKPDLAPLFALQVFEASVQRCGPDRGLTRNGEVRIHGVIVGQIEDLLELARGVA